MSGCDFRETCPKCGEQRESLVALRVAQKKPSDWDKHGRSKSDKSADPSLCARCGCGLSPGEQTHNTFEHEMGVHDSYYCNRCYGKAVKDD